MNTVKIRIKGHVVLFDKLDRKIVLNRKWHIVKDYNVLYAYCHVGRKPNRTTTTMHRMILGAPKGLVVDHINFNGLDNRRCNLRLCTHGQNSINRRPVRGYKGIHYISRLNKWRARVTHNGIRHNLGLFLTPNEAAKAYDEAAYSFHGEYAYLNFPESKCEP